METLSYRAPEIESFDSVFSSGSYNATQRSRYELKRGRHRRSSTFKQIRLKHGRRLISFSLIGFAVFAAGLLVQVLLVKAFGIPKVTAYGIQLVLSVQINFLANYRWTWADRNAPFFRSCWRYNVKRTAGTCLNFGLYPVLIHLGMNYLTANALLVVLLTPANYILGDLWTFAARARKAEETEIARSNRNIQLKEHVRERQLDMTV